MPEYEVIVIYEAGLPEEALDAEVESFKGFLDRDGGELLETQKWGKRRLAYEIKKRREGTYVLFRVKGQPTLPQALDRHLKFVEVILRYLVVKGKPRMRSKDERTTTLAAATEAGREGS
ncbi:MAG: 30S ribosomal protein S6 [Candidatus Methylomirabilales bacterium]